MAPLSKRAGARLLPDDAPASSRPLYQRLETLLAAGGDSRLALTRPEQKNAYGCTPFPRPELLDFASSTASTISEYAYAAAQQARTQLLSDAATLGIAEAFDARVEQMRARLRQELGLGEAEILFSPSGTDAQLHALFLVKALMGAPLATIIAGADQTGSGTQYTARGQHFSDGAQTRKGAAVEGLADGVRSVAIPFCDEAGALRSPAQMDDAILAAVAQAIAKGEKVLLQVMDSSKLGWRAPSSACLDTIAATRPRQVQIVVDACQMRLGQARLRHYLSRNFLVLITGSKFFTGPSFTGALLIPPAIAAVLEKVAQIPPGLCATTTRFDWPRRWPGLRAALPDLPNYGQWLRWEAALAEIEAYNRVPQAFRDAVLQEFAVRVTDLIKGSKHLHLLPAPARGDDDDMRPTIFSFVVQRDGKDIPADESAELYRAMGRDLTGLLPDGIDAQCQLGQPVLLRHRAGAALRLASSARLVTRCWSRDAATLAAALAPELLNVRRVIEKLDWLAEQPQILSGNKTRPITLNAAWDQLCTPRQGVARLTRLAFQGGDLRPVWNDLMKKASDDKAGAGHAMDLSIVAQLQGDKPTGLSIQKDALALQRLYTSPCEAACPCLRVLALAAVCDIGGNTPLEFLLEGSGIALATWYIDPSQPAPGPMPDHDVAIVVAGDADKATLAAIEKLSPLWPRPILNLPQPIRLLERDKLYCQLSGIAGLVMPATALLSRRDLAALAAGELPLTNALEDGSYPLIIRPAGSHAGFGLEKIDDPQALTEYLKTRPEEEFFLSRFVNYASDDGSFRKYRLAIVDGKPYACHMAIAEEWKVWYLNADMALSVPNRMEEGMFMHAFDMDFAAHHAHALRELIAHVGLDYFTIDCAQTPSGELLIFEADNTAIVHDMDPPNVYPYKSAQMQKIFRAVQAMLHRRAGRAQASAA